MKLVVAGLSLALLAASCSTQEAEPEARPDVSETSAVSVTSPTTTMATDSRHPVILDYSPTVSDIGALAFLASHPDLRLIGVTLPGTGESYCEPGVAHTRGVLVQLGLGDLPVACGPDDPITGWNAFPITWRNGSNEMNLPEAAPNESRSAPVLLADLIRTSDMPVELVAVGPLTNLAIVLDAEPSLAENIAGITIMGGAIEVPGNVRRNDVGEWNIWVDPTAAGTVIASDAPVTLIPLDATNYLPSGRIFWESLDAAAANPASTLFRDVWADNEDWIDNPGGFYFWDELAAAVLVDESIATFDTMMLLVEDEGRETKGWTRQDPSGSEIRVAVAADRRAFEQLFIDTIVGSPTRLNYVDTTPGELDYFAALVEINSDSRDAVDEIFESAATQLGFDDESEEGFLRVVALAVPTILDGPWAQQIERLQGLDPPSTLAEDHAAYVDLLVALSEARDEFLASLESGDFATFDEYFRPLSESCLVLQQEAALRALQDDLACP